MKKRIWNQLKKAVMITAAVGILGAGAVSAAEFEVAELYVPAVGLKQSAQWIDEEKFQAELTLEVSGLKELYKSQQENTASENGQLQMENSTWDGEGREAEATENTTDEVDSENTECESERAVIDIGRQKKTQKDLTQKPDRHNRVSRRTKMRSGKIKPDIF